MRQRRCEVRATAALQAEVVANLTPEHLPVLTFAAEVFVFF